MSAFEEFGVAPEVIQAIEEENWLLPTPVQAEAIPLILGGGDVCVAAETGSGKTGAFGLPILQVVHETLRNKAMVSTNKGDEHSLSSKMRLSLDDRDPSIFISGDGKQCKSESPNKWSGIRADVEVLKGRYMFEVVFEDKTDLARVGWSTSSAKRVVGTDNQSYGYGGTAKKSFNNSFEDYGEKFGAGDCLGCLIDRDRGEILFALNGTSMGVAFRLNPRTPGLYPTVSGKAFTCTVNFDSFKNPIEGFEALSNLKAEHSSSALTSAFEVAGKDERMPLCLIIEPTRDLAMQTHDCISSYGKYLKHPSIRTGLFIGGGDDRNQRDTLQQGLDIAVGTLPKISGLVRMKQLNVSQIKFLVLDEADNLVKDDGLSQIKKIKDDATHRGARKIQSLFFSATLQSECAKDAIKELTVSPSWVDLKGKATIPETVHCVVYKINPTLKMPLPETKIEPTTDGVHKHNSANSGEEANSERIKRYKMQTAVQIADMLKMQTCLIFCRTNLDCNNFEKYLDTLGGRRSKDADAGGLQSAYSCVVLAGMREQRERTRNLDNFKAGNVRFLICTDVAARGIDIQELPFLIMLTLPDDVDQFFHRVGRIGRADRLGLAVSLVATLKEKVWYHKCPKRGVDCSNTNLVQEGGCCIWFDEPLYLRQIEERIGNSIPEMNPLTLEVKGILEGNTKEPTKKNKKNDQRKRKLEEKDTKDLSRLIIDISM
eukprot:GHVP01036817.1.p1 GENE.GHVP01036817.1~~GHVP01036817.1.p1  ORF type:complete len:713 (+),score=113.02 GHVP01036817.1:35-2173(+)